jgi:hypothetical protein
MFRTSKCSSSGRVLHDILWHYYHVRVLVTNVSNIQVFILRKSFTRHFMTLISCTRISNKHILPSTILLVWMHERNTIKLHTQVFLRINIWTFQICRKQYRAFNNVIREYKNLLSEYRRTRIYETCTDRKNSPHPTPTLPHPTPSVSCFSS